jgi:ATP-dependent Clp protease protease subunit
MPKGKTMEQIRLDGIIGWDVTASDLQSKLPKNKEDPVNIYINSKGGDPFEGFAIYQLLDDYKDVTVEIGGIVASAASYIPFAAKNVITNKTTTWMGHKAWTFAIGNADDLQKECKVLSGIDGLIAGLYAEKTGNTKEDMLNAMGEEIWLFGGEAIKEFGIATSIKDSEEESNINESAVRSMIHAALKSYQNKGKEKPVNQKADLSADRERTVNILAAAGINDENTVSAIVNGATPEDFTPSDNIDMDIVAEKLNSVKIEVQNEIARKFGKI